MNRVQSNVKNIKKELTQGQDQLICTCRSSRVIEFSPEPSSILPKPEILHRWRKHVLSPPGSAKELPSQRHPRLLDCGVVASVFALLILDKDVNIRVEFQTVL
ncbi:uncharacterized protein Bfra_004167 [Botrytis fragariae]|uniref:Uncharacterized protein n=1 Tax=Botrytis fragariae TaxID=1964551 RepID=A0A8H6AVH6_9HELO|nr:uncharacterized protein Bfra_004167 [Botrytis fragariae]KAF5874160.1 hypothetical protein Bfra_004167 [Botrytis fragariae]